MVGSQGRAWRWLVWAGALGLAGCQSQDADRLAKMGRKVRERLAGVSSRIQQRMSGSLPPSEAGQSVKTRVTARLNWDKELSGADIDVDVQGDEVELRGTVRDATQLQRARELAEATKDVKTVKVSLTIPQP
jgi:osmotically-inducible protein OsmY